MQICQIQHPKVTQNFTKQYLTSLLYNSELLSLKQEIFNVISVNVILLSWLHTAMFFSLVGKMFELQNDGKLWFNSLSCNIISESRDIFLLFFIIVKESSIFTYKTTSTKEILTNTFSSNIELKNILYLPWLNFRFRLYFDFGIVWNSTSPKLVHCKGINLKP